MSDFIPRHVYRCGGEYVIVRNDETYQRALDQGWEDQPLPEWPVPESYQQLSALPEAPSHPEVPLAPKKRGRPRKTEI